MVSSSRIYGTYFRRVVLMMSAESGRTARHLNFTHDITKMFACVHWIKIWVFRGYHELGTLN